MKVGVVLMDGRGGFVAAIEEGGAGGGEYPKTRPLRRLPTWHAVVHDPELRACEVFVLEEHVNPADPKQLAALQTGRPIRRLRWTNRDRVRGGGLIELRATLASTIEEMAAHAARRILELHAVGRVEIRIRASGEGGAWRTAAARPPFRRTAAVLQGKDGITVGFCQRDTPEATARVYSASGLTWDTMDSVSGQLAECSVVLVEVLPDVNSALAFLRQVNGRTLTWSTEEHFGQQVRLTKVATPHDAVLAMHAASRAMALWEGSLAAAEQAEDRIVANIMASLPVTATLEIRPLSSSDIQTITCRVDQPLVIEGGLLRTYPGVAEPAAVYVPVADIKRLTVYAS